MYHLLTILFFITNLYSLTPEEFQKQQLQEFQSYKQTQLDAFSLYQKAQEKEFNDYKEEIAKIWDTPKMSTKKTWVSYSEDKKTRSNVDFEKETIIVETIASSANEAKEKLNIALAKVVTMNTKQVQENDPLEKRLAKLKKPKDIVDDKVEAEPILSTVIFEKKPTKKNVYDYVTNKISDSTLKTKKSKKNPNKFIYLVEVKMPSDTMIKRSRIYKSEVIKNAKKNKIPVPLVFAIMHSESNFNPRARSHIPAYGLMQIVPKTAGIDSYYFLYKKKKLVTGQYLYNSTNNIRMGTAYLHILYYRYLKKIKDPKSRLYCTIAAYNTGAGNIAWAFTKTYNMNKAAPYINKLSADGVYAKLLKDLRWDEPKHYLQRVSQRMIAYNKIYPM